MQIQIKLRKTEVAPPKDWDASKFADSVVKHFCKLFRQQGILKEEKIKNLYLAKLSYKKIKDRSIEFEFPEGVDSVEMFAKMENPEFWKEILDFMFKYADEGILKYYTQTINGMFSFYFKHYHRIKKSIELRNSNSEDRLIISQVRFWKKEDVISCFDCWVVRIYKHFNPDFRLAPNQTYYKYIKYIDIDNSGKTPPIIKPIILQNNQLIRGMVLQFKDGMNEWFTAKGFVLQDLIDFEEFEGACEKLGVELLAGKNFADLNDVIGSALYKFYSEKSINEYLERKS